VPNQKCIKLIIIVLWIKTVKVGKYGIDQETDASNTTLYYAGKFKSYEQALNCKNELVEQGFKDAFIIATDGKQRISVNRARQLLNQ